MSNVYFMSDYGLDDEFVGVVHSVISRLVPGVQVVDISHGIRPGDVFSAAMMLERALPYLGPGVVLAVVDPGVGTNRRALGIQAPLAPASMPGAPRAPASRRLVHQGERFFVGPDNGVFTMAIEALGGPQRAVALHPPGDIGRSAGPGWVPAAGPTFDGRDRFALAAARLCHGEELTGLGTVVDPGSLVSIERPGSLIAGGRLGTVVAWVDRFGNAELACDPGLLHRFVPDAGPTWRIWVPSQPSPLPLKLVDTFGELPAGELGGLVDSAGKLALVMANQSAAAYLRLDAGSEVFLAPDGGPCSSGARRGSEL